MSKTYFYIDCKVTGKREKWEDGTKEVRGGQGNELVSMVHFKNCMNIQCTCRGSERCPYDERYTKKL